MKLSEIKNVNEMAIRGGDMRTVADKFAARNEPLLKNSKHVGDIDSFNVKSDGKFFSLWSDDEMIALLKLDVIPNAHVIVDDLWVKDSFRGKKILSKLLWFLKSRENHPKILLGKVHTDDTQELLRAGGLSRFKRSWFNNTTGKVVDFDPKNIDKFYGDGQWSVMLEQVDCEFTQMSRFNTLEAGFVSQAYDWQIE